MNVFVNMIARRLVDYGLARLQEKSTAAGAAAALVAGLHLTVNRPELQALTDIISATLGLVFVVIKTKEGELPAPVREVAQMPERGAPVVHPPGTETTGQLNAEELGRHEEAAQ